MTGTEPVSETFGANTARSPITTPSVRMQREPTKAPSSTITGRACSGSKTPPTPTPPARCTSAPICAHEPTVAHVSTRSEEHTSELQSQSNIVCRLLLEKKKQQQS